MAGDGEVPDVGSHPFHAAQRVLLGTFDLHLDPIDVVDSQALEDLVENTGLDVNRTHGHGLVLVLEDVAGDPLVWVVADGDRTSCGA